MQELLSMPICLVAFAVLTVVMDFIFFFQIAHKTHKRVETLEEKYNDLVTYQNNLAGEVYRHKEALKKLQAQMWEVAIMQQNEKDTTKIINANKVPEAIKTEGELPFAIRKQRNNGSYHKQ